MATVGYSSRETCKQDFGRTCTLNSRSAECVRIQRPVAAGLRKNPEQPSPKIVPANTMQHELSPSAAGPVNEGHWSLVPSREDTCSPGRGASAALAPWPRRDPRVQPPFGLGYEIGYRHPATLRNYSSDQHHDPHVSRSYCTQRPWLHHLHGPHDEDLDNFSELVSKGTRSVGSTRARHIYVVLFKAKSVSLSCS